MTGRTHLMTGVLLTGVLVTYTPLALVPGAIGIIGSKAPDLDMTLGLKHRGVSHSLIAPLLLGLIGSVVSLDFAIVFALNYLLHIAMDSLTVKGVPLLMPINKKYYGLRLVKSGGAEDMLMTLAILWIISEILAKI